MKHEKYQICVMDLFSHRGITLILFGRSAIQSDSSVCTISFDGLNLLYFNKCFIRSSNVIRFGFTVKTKVCLLMKPTYDDIIEAKEIDNIITFIF